MSEHRCNDCNRNFANEEALNMHNSAKHSGITKSNKSARASFNLKKIKNWGILLIVVLIVFYGIYWSISNSGSFNEKPVTEINIGSHSNIALHAHSHLNIIIDGEERVIPANIGVSESLMRPLHTHGSSGEIHIEGPVPRDFTVGEFFQVWNKTFNENCIFDYCTDEGELTMSVNGQQNNKYNNYVMKDGDEITIEYNSE